MKRLLKGIATGIGISMSIGIVVLAAIASPAVQLINRTDAYQGVIETGDQLYITTFSLDYGTNPADDAGVNFLFRFSDNGTNIGEVAPTPFFNDGYEDGVISFYFDADNANIPTWQTANVSIEFTGNPTLNWGGDPPSITNNIITGFNEGASLVGARVRVIAQALENAWGVDLIELVNGVLVLTANGEGYFETAIPNLRSIAPDIFLSTTVSPEFDEREFTNTYATATENRWVGDPIFDTTDAATELNMGRVWLNSLIWMGVCIAMMVGIIITLKKVRPASFIFGAMMIIGSFAGFMTFLGGIFAGVIGAAAIVFALFYKGAP